MSLKIVVLAKQVPDTRCVGKDAMNADGTIVPTHWLPRMHWLQPSVRSASMTSSSAVARLSTAIRHR